jgi:DNA invertase Pin-like site-specific DNA recombinase
MYSFNSITKKNKSSKNVELNNSKKIKITLNLKRQNELEEDYNKKRSKKIRKEHDYVIDDIDNLLNDLSAKDTSMDAIIYIRCSSKKQNEDTQHGATTQLEICKEYAEKNKFNVVNIIEDICPGHNITRLQINNILEDDDYSNINIIVADPSRLSRSPSQGTTFVEECLKRKIICHSARDNISTDTNQGEKQFTGYFHDAKAESEVLRKRIKSMIYLKKKNGSHIGVAPYGYHLKKIISDESQYPITAKEEDEYEQKIIKLIGMLYFGNEREEIYKILREVTQNLLTRIYYYDESRNRDVEYELKIYYGNIARQDIADILNKNNILKRGKQWSKDMVGRIIIDLKKNKNIQYLYEDGNYYNIEIEYENKMEEYDEKKVEEEKNENMNYELSDDDSDDDCNDKITRMEIEMKKMHEELQKLKNKKSKIVFPELRKRSNYNYDNDSFDNEF